MHVSRRRILAGSLYSSASIILNLQFDSGIYYWNGSTSLSTALTCVRADTGLALAQNADGTFTGYAPNTPRIGIGRGLLVEPSTTNRLLWSRTFSNAVWTKSNLTLSDSGSNPISGTQTFSVEEVAVGSTGWVVPPGVTSISVYALGPGGSGAAGVTNTRGGGGGGGGAIALRTGISVTPGTTLEIAVPAGGAQAPTYLKDSSGTLQVSADFGTNASGTTAGTGGLVANSTGATRRAGGNGGSGSNGVSSRGGGGGGGAGNEATLGGSNNGGKGATSGTSSGGGGGGALGGGVTAAGAPTGTAGGVGGTNLSDTGGGAGGQAGVASGAGSGGGGGGGGLSGTGINAGDGSSSTWTISSGASSATAVGSGGGGGGGGFGGNGGNGGRAAGGGGGGSSNAAAGTAGTGGDGQLLIVYGAANATRITASANNAYLAQTYTASSTGRTPSLVIRPATVTGAIYLSQDGGLTQTDIASQLVPGRWVQAFAPWDEIVNPEWRLTIANSGDAVDIDLAQLEDNEFPTSPIPTTSIAVTRKTDIVTLNLSSFPAFVTNDQISVLATVYPGGAGTSVGGTLSRIGWTTCYINGFGDSMGDVTGSISGSTATITDAGSVTLARYQGVTGAGVAARTNLLGQLTGPDGGAGDYSVQPSQTVGSETLTIVSQEAYALNAAIKENGDQQIGVTVIDSLSNLAFGFDPQTAQYAYYRWNRIGLSATASTKSGITALNGDTESETRPTWADPSKFDAIYLGGASPSGSSALNGYMAELIILNTALSASELAAWTRQAA